MDMRTRPFEKERLIARTLLVFVCTLLLVAGVSIAGATDDTSTPTTSDTTTDPSATSTAPEDGVTPGGGGGGNINNEVVVLNMTDGRFANRAGFGVARVTGDTAENQNAAAATSSCSDCRTVAVAVQIVLVQRTNATNISPRNIAIALNQDCQRCETFAAAYQYVVTTDGLVRFTPEGNQRLAELQNEIRALAATDGVPFPELEARIDARVEQMWAIVDTELAQVGSAFKDTDEATDGASPSVTATPTDTASPTDSSTAEGTEPEDTASPTPSESASPSPSETEGSEPTPSSTP